MSDISSKEKFPIGDPRRYDDETESIINAIIKKQADTARLELVAKQAEAIGTNDSIQTVEGHTSREIVDSLPVKVTPCLARVHGIPANPVYDGMVLAIAADKRVYFPSPATGEWYPNGMDVTGYVTDIKLP